MTWTYCNEFFISKDGFNCICKKQKGHKDQDGFETKHSGDLVWTKNISRGI